MIYAKKQIGQEEIKRPFTEKQWDSLKNNRHGWVKISEDEYNGGKTIVKMATGKTETLEEMKPLPKKESAVPENKSEDESIEDESQSDVNRILSENKPEKRKRGRQPKNQEK